MQKIINTLINENLKGVDLYHYEDSLWLIFTDRKEWVLELVDSNILWYNYRFFINLFRYVSLGVAENQHYITKWAEDTIQNGIRHTDFDDHLPIIHITNAIENGIKDIFGLYSAQTSLIEDVIKKNIQPIFDLD